MGRKSSGALVVLLAAATLASGCGRAKKPIVVGSKDTTEQTILGEIVAQHLEHRLGYPVVRNLGLGNRAVVYQALLNGEIGIYPEETGTIQATVLRETPSKDAGTTLEGVRREMSRIAQAEVMDPLGVDNSWAIVVKKSDTANKIETLSEASNVHPGWRLGVTRDFNERSDGLPTLNQYRLPMGAVTFVSDIATLYTELRAGRLTMVAGNATDWQLARYVDLKVIQDDKKVFGFYQTCLMVKKELIANEPKLEPALAELSGRITNTDIQKLEGEVVNDHRKLADVAAEFLTQAGLK